MSEHGVVPNASTAPRAGTRSRRLRASCSSPSGSRYRRSTSCSTSVRARPGRLNALSVLHSESVSCGAFAWARRSLNGRKRRFPTRAGSLPHHAHPRHRSHYRLLLGGDRLQRVGRAAGAGGGVNLIPPHVYSICGSQYKRNKEVREHDTAAGAQACSRAGCTTTMARGRRWSTTATMDAARSHRRLRNIEQPNPSVNLLYYKADERGCTARMRPDPRQRVPGVHLHRRLLLRHRDHVVGRLWRLLAAGPRRS